MGRTWRMWRVLGAMAAVVLAGCWPHVGHDAGRTYWNPAERVLTPATVGELGELWRTPVHPGPTFGWVAQPVSMGGAVYLPGSRGRLARVDAATGEVVWRRTLDPGVAPEPPELDQPVVFRGALRVTWSCCRAGVFGTFWVAAATGEDADAPPGATGGVYDPAVAGGALAGLTIDELGVTTVTWGDMSVAAVRGPDGQPASQFAITGGRIHWAYGPWAQAFSACHPQNDPHHPCAPDWRTDLGGEPGAPAAVGRGAVAYPVGTGVVVLDTATGAVLWQAPLGTGASRLVVAGSTILAATAGDEVVALPAGGCGAETCAPLWRAPVGGLRDLAAGGDVAYATTDGGTVVALGVDGCGAATPTCAPLAEVDVGGTLSSPVVDGGRVVVADADGTLVALGLPR